MKNAQGMFLYDDCAFLGSSPIQLYLKKGKARQAILQLAFEVYPAVLTSVIILHIGPVFGTRIC